MPISASHNPLAPPRLPREDTLRWLAHCKKNFWWKSQMPFTEQALAGVIGMDIHVLKESLRNQRSKTDVTVSRRIGEIVPNIEKRKLCFPERKIGVPKKGETISPQFLWLDPPARPPKIERLGHEGCWSLWAECLRCGNNKFLPIVMNDKPHVACSHCLPPSQYPALGAGAVKKSLIHEALKKFY